MTVLRVEKVGAYYWEDWKIETFARKKPKG
jgi:hypothetical protein